MKIIHSITYLGIFLNHFSGVYGTIYDNKELIVSLPSGEYFVLDVLPHETFVDVMRQASDLAGFDEISTYSIDYTHLKKGVFCSTKFSSTSLRDYQAKVTAKEREDILYIVTTLGKASLDKLRSEESSLTKAGDRVIHVHPMNFAIELIKNEKARVAVLQIESRMISSIAKKFFGGLYGSFDEEADKDNVQKYSKDFAHILELDPNKVDELIEKRDWKGLFNLGMNAQPRSKNSNRHSN